MIDIETPSSPHDPTIALRFCRTMAEVQMSTLAVRTRIDFDRLVAFERGTGHLSTVEVCRLAHALRNILVRQNAQRMLEAKRLGRGAVAWRFPSIFGFRHLLNPRRQWAAPQLCAWPFSGDTPMS